MQPHPFRSLAFVINEKKAGASQLGEALMALAREHGVAVRATHQFPPPEAWLRGCDACCVIGGDGTLLGVVREAARQQVPIIGVNRGSLGFLTTYSAEEVRAQFPALLAGDYQIAWRSLLSCATAPGQPAEFALNDVLLKDERNSHLVRLEVYADDELITDYFSDGLIFSTPTGSTAYNLSAGGPLIHPAAEVIAMTPICPHTLSNRSIIFPQGVKLRIFNCADQARLLVGIDGQRQLVSCADAPIEISLASLRLPLVQRRDYAHFSVVRTKLKWSGGAANDAR
jgi:NAD+ kinase